MDALRRTLILREIESRSQAAETLRASGDESDSAYLLQLLAFELLLKLLVEEITGNRPPKHHRYEEVFKMLPDSIQRELLAAAGARIGPSALSKNPTLVLAELGANFISLRYPYDKYADLTEEQYSNLGAAWIEAGAKIEDATFRYYPEELFGLTYAAQHLAGC